MKELLPKLAAKLERFRAVGEKIKIPPFVHKCPEYEGSHIEQDWFWPRMGSFFREKDVIITETGNLYPHRLVSKLKIR